MNGNKPIILIPTYNPDMGLVNLARSVTKSGFLVIIVNDGSAVNTDHIFKKLAKISNCIVLEHGVNLGKGRAIKTAINHITTNYPGNAGVVTADSDGQHTAADIEKVASKLQSSKSFVLGCRKFSGEIPLRSRIGNIITKRVFRFLIGKSLSDTQTGLRGIPARYLKQLMTLRGERYEYEINVLAYVGRNNGRIIEVPIDTIYIDDNKSSHFNPLLDSMRIYFVLLRFLASSMTSTVIDYILFAIFFLCSESMIYSAVAARGISILVNYNMNRSWVFSTSKPHTFVKFLILASISLTTSCMFVSYLTQFFGLNVFIVKIIV
ncbi:MAG: bifunctional glycosyltransferase family 2/GtrA family protein, partial [Holosporales bacterium]|nr:bifunctional glycosyltransferase family 2/GtrA family protein [Holosporales bacterium]